MRSFYTLCYVFLFFRNVGKLAELLTHVRHWLLTSFFSNPCIFVLSPSVFNSIYTYKTRDFVIILKWPVKRRVRSIPCCLQCKVETNWVRYEMWGCASAMWEYEWRGSTFLTVFIFEQCGVQLTAVQWLIRGYTLRSHVMSVRSWHTILFTYWRFDHDVKPMNEN